MSSQGLASDFKEILIQFFKPKYLTRDFGVNLINIQPQKQYVRSEGLSNGTNYGIISWYMQDGCVCWFDMRCKDLLFTMDAAQNPISSLCFKPG